jgi:hypothetical protein
MTGIDRDILITRVLDGEATPEDWAAFRAMAARDQSVWAELADAQQDRAELAGALAEAIAVADTVHAPIEVHAGERFNTRLRRGVAWAGWAAAAMLAVGAFTGRLAIHAGPGAQEAGLFPVSSSEDALKLYFDKGQESGRVLGEMPDRVLLSSEPLPDGSGFTVVYLRQFVEQQQVPDLFQLGINEAGERVPVPIARPLHGVRY